ncbi:MAG: hydrolase [Pseudomonadota bacterium]|nr:hydrolase [Pseudomonadota bacterium]
MIRKSEFLPAWWLRNAHAQTLWPVWFRPRRGTGLRRERLELPDGDFIDLDWGPTRSGAVVLIFHGLEGSSRSHYAAGLLNTFASAGYQGVVAHFRGCSGEPNRLSQSYTAGETADIAHIAKHARRRCPGRPLITVGISLGGNAMLKWLAQLSESGSVNRAAAVSVPFDLSLAADRLETGFSRVYQRYLLRKLRRSTVRKTARPEFPVSNATVHSCDSIRMFDDRVTAPLHGYRNVSEYYGIASCRQYLGSIRTPTLILHARDDPFMTEAAIPDESELSDSIEMEISDRGGHVGFVTGPMPVKPRYWVDQRLLQWVAAQQER